jgi:tetratricopeptide (TPR) repeat protein
MRLHKGAPPDPSAADTTTLGEWYANLITVRRRRFVLFVNAATRLAVMTKPAPPKKLHQQFQIQLAALLDLLDIPRELIERELDAIETVIYSPTRDRSVLSTMTQIAKELQYIGNRVDLSSVEGRIDAELQLSEMIHGPLGAVYPAEVVQKKFGVPATGKQFVTSAGIPILGLADLPPPGISVEQFDRHEWRFVYERIDREVQETVDKAVGQFQRGSGLASRRTLERLVRDYPEFIDGFHCLAMFYSDRSPGDTAAHDLWSHAVDIGLSCLPEEFQMGRDHLPWTVLENRPFLSACHGIGLELYRHGRLEEAIGFFSDIFLFDPDDHLGARYLLVDTFLRIGDDTGALTICAAHDKDDGASILYGLPLALLRLGRNDEAQAAIEKAIDTRPLVAEALVHPSRELPSGYRPGYITLGGADEASEYARECGDLWESTPGAREWLAGMLKRVDAEPANSRSNRRRHTSAAPDNVIPFPGKRDKS